MSTLVTGKFTGGKNVSLGRIMTLYSRNVQTYGSLAHDIKRNQCRSGLQTKNRIKSYEKVYSLWRDRLSEMFRCLLREGWLPGSAAGEHRNGH